MTRLAAALLVLLVGACAADVGHEPYVDPTERAIQIYTEIHGAPSADCAQHAYAVEFFRMDHVELARACQVPPNTWMGCSVYDPEGSVVYLGYTTGDGGATAAHEVMHLVLACEGKDDPEHTDDVWNWPGIR